MNNKKRILIVEDEVAILRATSDRLTDEDYEMIEAKDGKAGLDLALKEHPDLILLDILMPKMDGVQVMKKLREDSWGKSVPVILLTKLDLDDQKLREIVQYGAAYYLVKRDWSLEDVVKKVKEVLIKQ